MLLPPFSTWIPLAHRFVTLILSNCRPAGAMPSKAMTIEEYADPHCYGIGYAGLVVKTIERQYHIIHLHCANHTDADSSNILLGRSIFPISPKNRVVHMVEAALVVHASHKPTAPFP